MDKKNEEILEEWFFKYSLNLMIVAQLKVDYHTAEEVVQETFRVVCEMDDLSKIMYPQAWLKKVLYYVMQNRIRQREAWKKIITEVDEAVFSKKAVYVDPINIELEYQGVVSDKDLHLLKLLAVDNYTYAEVAELFNISAEACRKRAKRAEVKLKKFLKEYH